LFEQKLVQTIGASHSIAVFFFNQHIEHAAGYILGIIEAQ
jgi:hypothetical protein